MNGIMEAWIDMWTGVVMGTIGTVSCDRWTMAWIMMEVNLISFIPLIAKRWRRKKVSIIYFIAQSAGSLTMLSGGLLSDHSMRKIVTVGLLLKAGLAPTHFWAPRFVDKVRNFYALTFLTWQKIAPLSYVLIHTTKNIIILIILLNMVASSRAVGTKSIKLLMFFTSLLHTSWILMGTFNMAIKYFIFYVVITVPIFIKVDNLLLLNQAGLPPITGFIIKIEMLQCNVTLGILLLAASVFTLYSYIRIFATIKEAPTASIFVCSLGMLA